MGDIWYTIRRAGGWNRLDGIPPYVGIRSPVVSLAATSALVNGETQYVFGLADGHLWWVRLTDAGQWSGIDLQAQLAVPGFVSSVATSDSNYEWSTRIGFTTNDGRAWYTRRSYQDGTYLPLSQMMDQGIQPPGPITALASAKSAYHEQRTVFLAVTSPNGRLWQSTREGDGTFRGWIQPLAFTRAVRAVAGASVFPDGPLNTAYSHIETQFMFVTDDGHVWHARRNWEGKWGPLGDVNAQIRIPGPVRAVAAVGVQADTQYMLVTEDGHLWHTIRRADGSWQALGDVNSQVSIPGPVAAVTAASCRPGEALFMILTK